MNPTDKLNLPSRLRESSFKRYEVEIDLIVKSFPQVIVVPEIAPLSKQRINLVTFASRLRDAMASLVTYRWTSELIDMDKFDELYHKIKVSHVMSDRVVIGSAENIKAYYTEQNIDLPPNQFECFTNKAAASVVDATLPPVGETTSSTVVSLSQDTHDADVELKFLADLAALRLLNSAVEIKISAEQAKYLEDNFDVVLTKVSDNKYTMQ